jgi:hypothetical protein
LADAHTAAYDGQGWGAVAMTGYNHFLDCPCGWCVNYKRYRDQFRPLAYDSTSDNAATILREYGVNRSFASCFVNPNAKCPVCFAAVYYYENSQGSRVFFDDLGWPWPKHPCTDSRKQIRTPCRADPHPIHVRKRGEIDQIATSLAQARRDPRRDFFDLHGEYPPDLLRILEVRRVGFENFLKAYSVSLGESAVRYLHFTSAKLTPQVGEFVSVGSGYMSVFDASAGQQRKFKLSMLDSARWESLAGQP